MIPNVVGIKGHQRHPFMNFIIGILLLPRLSSAMVISSLKPCLPQLIIAALSHIQKSGGDTGLHRLKDLF